MIKQVKIGITFGDPSGIGPEIIAKAIPRIGHLGELTIIGDRWVFSKVNKLQIAISDAQRGKLRFMDLNNVDRKSFRFGKVKAEYGRASLEYLDKAIGMSRHKEIDCLVTAPVSKEAISLTGKKFTGHTEYLKNATGTHDIVMMLVNKYLKISLMTRHVALSKVADMITAPALAKTIMITRKALQESFGIRKPSLVVCGLNPHASDNGVIGNQESMVITPALKILKKKTGCISGPISADVALAGVLEKRFDAAIAMYHDQALIALKISDKHSGVNLSLGLPFIRTSPLHGTAFDLAGKDSASPDSFIEACRLAVKCTLNQRKV